MLASNVAVKFYVEFIPIHEFKCFLFSFFTSPSVLLVFVQLFKELLCGLNRCAVQGFPLNVPFVGFDEACQDIIIVEIIRVMQCFMFYQEHKKTMLIELEAKLPLL